MPSQARAIDILRTCRAWTDGVVSGLTSAERTVATPLGDGTWSVKDLLGHLATHEHRALVVMGARRPAGDQLSSFDSVASFNDHHLAKKRSWSLKKVETDYAATRDELVAAIDATTDDRWIEKVPHGAGRSWLGLALGKMLNGDKYGYFAHDFAHRRGLERAAEALRQRRS
ncbi:MAG: hypothetical protein QOG03_451 [Actinomycetota bacterium]|jgi:hypothetical protein|nr:hypothetical protein [Actinomycetota bacterium]